LNGFLVDMTKVAPSTKFKQIKFNKQHFAQPARAVGSGDKSDSEILTDAAALSNLVEAVQDEQLMLCQVF
jgi:hypothetical protein